MKAAKRELEKKNFTAANRKISQPQEKETLAANRKSRDFSTAVTL